MKIPEELQNVLTADSKTLSGAVRFKGTRVPVQALIDTLDVGQGIDDFLDGWPNVPRESAQAVIKWEQSLAKRFFDLESAPISPFVSSK